MFRGKGLPITNYRSRLFPGLGALRGITGETLPEGHAPGIGPSGTRFRSHPDGAAIISSAKVCDDNDIFYAESGMDLSSSPRRGCQKIKRRRYLAKAFKMTFTRKHALAPSIALPLSNNAVPTARSREPVEVESSGRVPGRASFF